jgi:hypothetical protein
MTRSKSGQALAQQYARDWWAAYPERWSAICDRCSSDIQRNEGCLVEGMGLDLICNDCFDGHTPANFKKYRAKLDALKARHSGKLTAENVLGIGFAIVFWGAVIVAAIYYFS